MATSSIFLLVCLATLVLKYECVQLCIHAGECQGQCDLQTRHWACITHECICRDNNVPECFTRSDCEFLKGASNNLCPNDYHCFDGRCICHELPENDD